MDGDKIKPDPSSKFLSHILPLSFLFHSYPLVVGTSSDILGVDGAVGWRSTFIPGLEWVTETIVPSRRVCVDVDDHFYSYTQSLLPVLFLHFFTIPSIPILTLPFVFSSPFTLSLNALSSASLYSSFFHVYFLLDLTILTLCFASISFITFSRYFHLNEYFFFTA